MIVLLAVGMVGGGCATTSSQNAQYKPHKPQIITANGPEEVGDDNDGPWYILGHGFKLSDKSARVLNALGSLTGLPTGSTSYSWKP
jgi:hypothetical protein